MTALLRVLLRPSLILPLISCLAVAAVGRAEDPVKITVQNTTTKDLKVVYLEEDKEVDYVALKAGEKKVLESYEGIKWRFKDGDQTVGEYLTKADAAQSYAIKVGGGEPATPAPAPQKMTLRLFNEFPQSVDVSLVSADKKTERPITTIPPRRIEIIDRIQTIIHPAEGVDQEVVAGQVWRFRLRRPVVGRDGRKTGESPQGDSVLLYDYTIKPVQFQAHRLISTEYLRSQLQEGMEVTLFDPEQGLIMADDNPVERFGPPVNSYGVRLRREATLVDAQHKNNNYVWIVAPGNTGAADTISFRLKGYRAVYLSSDYPVRIPGRKLLGVAERPAAQDPKDPAVETFNQGTTFNIRMGSASDRMGVPLLLERSDATRFQLEGAAPRVVIEPDALSVQLMPDGSKITTEFRGATGVTTITTYAADGTVVGVKRSRKAPEPVVFGPKPTATILPPDADTPKALMIPWGESAARMPLETLRVIGIQVDSGASWRAKDPTPFAQPNPDEIKEDADSGTLGTDQLVSAIRYCRAGYHQVQMNPLELEENGLAGKQGNPIFARQSDRKAGSYYLDGNYRIPIDFFFDGKKKAESKESSRMFTSQGELMSSISGGSSNFMDLNISASASLGVPPVTATVGVATNTTFGQGSEFGQMVSAQSSKSNMINVRTKWNSEFWLVLNKQNAAISNNFRDDLLALQESKSRDAFDAFFRKYGTHYPIASLFGGRATEVQGISSSSLNQSVKYDSGSNNANGYFKSNKAASDSSGAGNSEEQKDFKAIISGGQGTNWDGWSKGNVPDYVPIKVYMRPIWELAVADLLFKQPTAADHALSNHLRLAMVEQWQRHLNDAASGYQTRYNPPTDLFELRVDNPNIRCLNDRDRAEFNGGKKSFELRVWGVRIKDVAPLSGKFIRSKIPDDYGISWHNLVDEDQIKQNKTDSLNGKEYHVDLSTGEHDLQPLRALVAIRRADVPNAQPSNDCFAIRVGANFRKSGVIPAIAHVGGDRNFQTLKANNWYDLGYAEAAATNSNEYIGNRDGIMRGDSALIGRAFTEYRFYHFIKEVEQGRMSDAPGFAFAMISHPLAQLVKNGPNSLSVGCTWECASEKKQWNDTKGDIDEGLLRKMPIRLSHQLTVRYLTNNPPPVDDGMPQLAYFNPPPSGSAFNQNPTEDKDSEYISGFPNRPDMTRVVYTAATRTYTTYTLVNGKVVDVVKSQKKP